MDNLSINPMKVSQVNALNKTQEVQNVQVKDYPNDSVEFTTKKEETSLTKEEKQEMVLKARTTAAGWSGLFGVFSTAWYALKPDNKIAEKYGLDENKDKDLVKTIRKQQVKATIPSIAGYLLFGVGALLTGGATWIYNKHFADASKIEVE